jgi:hypothetical protein
VRVVRAGGGLAVEVPCTRWADVSNTIVGSSDLFVLYEGFYAVRSNARFKAGSRICDFGICQASDGSG